MATRKRIVPGWNEYFMRMVDLAKTKSKDRSTQVGALVVDRESHAILSTGYNGFPRGVNDDVESRHERPAKLLYTEHAERNAVYAAARNGVRILGSAMYVSGFPCADCARAIIQSGIRVVVTMDRPFEGKSPVWEESCSVGREMLYESGVALVLLDDQFRVSRTLIK